MMIFNEEDRVSEWELVSEQAQEDVLAVDSQLKNEVLKPDDNAIDEILKETEFDLEKEDVDVVYNARVRLEQARLYEMLIDHNIFDGVDADPKAVEIVKNELKVFIVRRLKRLLGLVEDVEVSSESTFNPVEVDFLKALAFKGTKGQSARAEAVKKETKPKAVKRKSKKNNKGSELKTLEEKIKKAKSEKEEFALKKKLAMSRNPVTKSVVEKGVTGDGIRNPEEIIGEIIANKN